MIAPILLLSSLPLCACYHRSTSLADCFVVVSISADKDTIPKGLPGVFPGSALRLNFQRYKDVAGRSLPGFISVLTSPGTDIIGPGLYGSLTLSSSFLYFPAAFLRIEILICIPFGIIQMLISLFLLLS